MRARASTRSAYAWTAGPILLALGLLFSSPATAQVTTTSKTSYSKVSGKTAAALVGSLLRHPIAGDHGAAFANIRPNHRFDVEAAQDGGLCRATKVSVSISYRITLPQATSRLDGGTATAWNQFVRFATRHEQWHQRSYTDCARRFVRAALQQVAPSCSSVSFAVRRMFQEARRNCDAEQLAFDRRQRKPLSRLRLFRMADY